MWLETQDGEFINLDKYAVLSVIENGHEDFWVVAFADPKDDEEACIVAYGIKTRDEAIRMLSDIFTEGMSDDVIYVSEFLPASG